ncbi:MAG: hypothetical protein NTZ67_06305 [Gammaproteobacteria bacterium]|nr:hypothetical protein [Gammaproteobacteria bacterium]
MEMTNPKKTAVTPFLLVGIIAGCALALIEKNKVVSELPFIWINLYALFFLVAYPTTQSIWRLFITTLITSFLASIPFVWQFSNHITPFSSVVLCVVNAYALLVFHAVYQTYRFKMPYQALFFCVWNTFTQLLIAFFFALFSRLILDLTGDLFVLTHINFFHDLFDKIWFSLGCSAFLMSLGLYFSTQTHNLVHHIRGAILSMCRYLLPVLAIIAILFFISGLISYFILHQAPTLSTPLFLSLSFFSILFINGFYQDGQTDKHYPRIITLLCTIFLCILPIFTLLALYAIQKDFNALNFALAVNALLLFTYNVSYAVISVRSGKPWMKGIEKANIILAVLLIIVTVLTTNPWILAVLSSR